jgi:hypothetical protein
VALQCTTTHFFSFFFFFLTVEGYRGGRRPQIPEVRAAVGSHSDPPFFAREGQRVTVPTIGRSERYEPLRIDVFFYVLLQCVHASCRAKRED